MSDKEKHWYQDGWNILTIVAVLILIAIWSNRYWQHEKEQQKPQAMALNVGHLEQPLDGDPVLHLKFWHVHRGNLKNGRMTVVVDYPAAPKDQRIRIHAFDTWEPNDDHAVIWKVPLPGYQLDQRVPVRVRLEAENARPFAYTEVWLGTDWVEDQLINSE